MADEKKTSALEIDHLYDFLDGLQASGYTIDTRQYLALSDLLMLLIARGNLLDELSLKTLIAPLICSTPAEQQDFYQRFDYWHATLLPIAPKKDKIEDLTNTLLNLLTQRERRFSINSRSILLKTFGVVGLIVFIVWLVFNLGIITAILNNSKFIFYSSLIALFALAIWIGWQIWIRIQENQYITRELAGQDPVYTKVSVSAFIQDVLPIMQFKPIVSTLRKRVQAPAFEIDVERTIENALNRTNWLEIIYRQKQVMPEYVVLIDRKSRLDQQARFVQEVLVKLAADGVWLHQYEFNSDLRICFPLDHRDNPLRLKELQSRHPDSRLLIFSNVNELINPLTGLLQDWLEGLSFWENRAILTPDTLQKVLLEELQSQDFVVLPMTFEGLASLVRAFETEYAPTVTYRGKGLPVQLMERPARWVSRDMPSETEIEALLHDVKNYLGVNGFYWLCACAVYPELRWELTLHLGSALTDTLGKPLLNPDLLIRLSQLPWYRFGYMPDWMRLALIESFTSEQASFVHEVLGNLFSSVYRGNDFDLIFSRSPKASIQNRTNNFLKALIRKAPPESLFQDQIFIKFIAKRQLKKIAFRAPAQLRKLLSAPSWFASVHKLTDFFVSVGAVLSPRSLRMLILRRIEEQGRNAGQPSITFAENQIVVVGEDLFTRTSFLQQLLNSNAFYLNLPPTVYGVIVSPDGTMRNMAGGLHIAPPGLYKLYYVDKSEKLAITSPVSELTKDGERNTIRAMFRYRVVDPVTVLSIDRPVETLIKHIESDIANYIRANDHNEVSRSVDDSSDGKLLLYIIERHSLRIPLFRAIAINGVEVKEFSGDQEYIEMRHRALEQEQNNKVEVKQLEYQLEIDRLKAQLKTELETIQTNQSKEQEEILFKIQKREIELENIRNQTRRRHELQLKAIEAISQALQITEYSHSPGVIRNAIADLLSAIKDEQSKPIENVVINESQSHEAELEELRNQTDWRNELVTKAVDAIGQTLESSGYPENSNEMKNMVASLLEVIKEDGPQDQGKIDDVNRLIDDSLMMPLRQEKTENRVSEKKKSSENSTLPLSKMLNGPTSLELISLVFESKSMQDPNMRIDVWKALPKNITARIAKSSSIRELTVNLVSMCASYGQNGVEILVSAIEKTEGDTDQVKKLKSLLNGSLIPLELKEELAHISKTLRDRPSQIRAAKIDEYIESVKKVSSMLEGYSNSQTDITLFVRTILREKLQSIQKSLINLRAITMAPGLKQEANLRFQDFYLYVQRAISDLADVLKIVEYKD